MIEIIDKTKYPLEINNIKLKPNKVTLINKKKIVAQNDPRQKFSRGIREKKEEIIGQIEVYEKPCLAARAPACLAAAPPRAVSSSREVVVVIASGHTSFRNRYHFGERRRGGVPGAWSGPCSLRTVPNSNCPPVWSRGVSGAWSGRCSH